MKYSLDDIRGSVSTTLTTQLYGPSYKALCLAILKYPTTAKDCFWLLWGTDIWFGCIPFCKTIMLANLVMWAILFLGK